MAHETDTHTRTRGAPFFNQIAEFMNDLAVVPALAEKLAAKMEEIRKAASGSGKLE